MGINSSAGNTRLVETLLTSDSVADSSYTFELNGGAPRNNLLEYFYFVDGSGDPVAATGGTVDITFSPILPLYQDITNGSFLAAIALDSDWPKPNGYGKAVSIRINLTGITGPPTGFRALMTQSVA